VLAKQALDELEELTRKGDSRQVHDVIVRFGVKEIPRPLLNDFARLCFRNGHYQLSLRILSPAITAHREGHENLSFEEMIAYALALQSIGLIKEAKEWLIQVPSENYPEVLLNRAFCFFGEWKYQDSLPLLKKYIHHPRITDYRKIVGEVNIAAALISCEMTNEGLTTIEKLIEVVSANKYDLLHMNCLELKAQALIQQQEFSAAEKILDEAFAIMPDSQSIYQFFVRKWKVICRLFLNSEDASIRDEYLQIRAEASKRKHPESLRDLDLYWAFICKDEGMLQRILHGTKNISYIKRAENLYDGKLRKNKELILNNSDNSLPVTEEKHIKNIFETLKEHPLQYQFLREMLSDFYRPASLGDIFQILYKDEVFNAETSPKRILNQFYSLKKNLDEIRAPIHIHKEGSSFAWTVQPHCQLHMIDLKSGLQSQRENPESSFLRSQINRPFSSSDVMTAMHCSLRTAQMKIKKWLEQEKILSFGSGPSVRYLSTSSPLKKQILKSPAAS